MNSFSLSGGYPGFRLDARAEWDAPRTALFGASGSGKTTILESLVGLRPEIAGRVALAGASLDGLPPERRRLGWIPQDSSLFPHLSVLENVRFAVRDADDARAADEAVERLEIGDLLARRAADLSGGERQRVAIARALASRPRFLLLDEPLASLDRPLRSRVLPLLADLHARTGVPMLIVSHDVAEVAALADRVLVIEGGRVTASVHPQELIGAVSAWSALERASPWNVFDVAARSRGEGVLMLETGLGCTLAMADAPGFAPPRRVCVSPDDVLVSMDRPGRVSAQNVLEGVVERIEPVGEHALVHVRCIETFVARLTPRAVRALGLAPGTPVHLLVKAHSIRPA